MKKALITGITGQDGALLAAFLLEKSYEVHGIVRRASLPNTARIAALLGHPSLHLHYADVIDAAAMITLIQTIQPQEIYNLAAQSDVLLSFTMPAYTLDTNASGTLTLLEATRILPKNSCRFYQASTSEIFGNHEAPQTEQTPFQPVSPYGISKLCAYWLVVNYRQAHGLFAANGILFNHESPLRGERFVSRKITRAVAAFAHGGTTPLKLGNLDARRDWGHSQDYIRGMWGILQHSTPDDYILATGTMHSVRTFAELAFGHIGCKLQWQGSGLQEKGLDAKTGQVMIEVDPAFFRPVELHSLCGDASKARKILGWEPTINFEGLVADMVKNDIENYKSAAYV